MNQNTVYKTRTHQEVEGPSLQPTHYMGTSMYPTLKESDLLEVQPCGADEIQRGDVIAFRSDYCEETTIHRAIEVGEMGIQTQGDRNDSVDPFWIQPHQVLGKVNALWRGQKNIRVLNGMLGLIWSYFIRVLREIDRAISPMIHPFYRSFSTNSKILGMLSSQFEPQIHRFKGNGRVYYKVILGNRVVGLYDNDLEIWRISRPFRVFVDETKLARVREL